MRRLGVAVAGLGTIGRVHVEAIKEIEKSSGIAKLVAVLSRDRAKVEELARSYGVKGCLTEKEVARDPEVDVVIVATPTYLHGPQAIFYMEYGKHVIVEKPMATSLVEAREMIAKSRKLGVKLGVVFQERYAHDIAMLKKIIDDGGLGKLLLIEGDMKWWRGEEDYYLRGRDSRSWRGMWGTEGGGALTNQGIHTVDLLIWFGGDVELVAGMIANLSHPSITVEDTAVASMRFKSGALGTLVATVSAQPPTMQYRKIRVFGTEGRAEITDRTLTHLFTSSGRRVSHAEQPKSDTLKQGVELHRRLLEDFLSALLEDKDFPIPGEDGIKSLELVKAIYLSSRMKSFVKLPLDIDILV